MTLPGSATKSVASLIFRVTTALFDPDTEQLLMGLDNGQPIWTQSPARALTWFTEEAAMKIAKLLQPDHQLLPVEIRYVRPASDPLGWRHADD